MAAQKPTYILAPNWDFLPDGPIALGSVVIDPKNPARSLNRNNRRPVETKDITISTKQDWSITREKLLSGSMGLWASFLAPILGIGPDVAVHNSKDKNDVYECKTLETQYFQPDHAYIAETLQNPFVMAYTEKFWHKSVYMVTGVKIARGATMTTVAATGIGGEVNVALDGTQSGIPVSGGPKINGEREKKVTVKFGGSDDFVLGYQLLRIKSKRDGSFTEEDYNKCALFSDDDFRKVADSNSHSLEEAWYMTYVVMPFDDLQGMVVKADGQEDCNFIICTSDF